MNHKKVVKESCANYQNGLCLIRNIECPLVTAFVYRGHQFPTEEAECSYFNKYVLGIRERDEDTCDTLTENVPANIKKVIYSYRDCALCGDSFKPSNSRNKYCSKTCTKLARKRINNRYYTNKS